MKDKNVQLSLKDIGPKLGVFFHRYGLLVFFLTIAAGLIAAVILLNAVIAQTDNPDGYVSDVNNINFDTDTINKVRDLRSSDQATKKIETDGGRLLPF